MLDLMVRHQSRCICMIFESLYKTLLQSEVVSLQRLLILFGKHSKN